MIDGITKEEHSILHAMIEKHPDAAHEEMMAAAWADLGAHMEGRSGKDVDETVEMIMGGEVSGPVQARLPGGFRA